MLGIKQRLFPDSIQAAGLVEHCHHARFVYNIGLEQRSMWRRDKHQRGSRSAPPITYRTQAAELTQLRREFDWLHLGSSSVQQQALRDLDRAFANFFAGKAKYPTYKRRDERSGGFYVRDLTVRRLNRRLGTIMVPKVGPVRFRISRQWADIDAAVSARVTHQNGQWHVCFTTPISRRSPAGTGRTVGIDRGVTNTIATSHGEIYRIPTWTTREQTRFRALHQQLSRQTAAAKAEGRVLDGCRNRAKTLDAIARMRARLEDRRSAWVEEITTQLARTFDVVIVEDLQIRNMVRRPAPKPDPQRASAHLPNHAKAKAALNRAIYGSRWGQFANRIEHKSNLIRVRAAYSSQECRRCHRVAPENRKSQAEFWCIACGHTNHADTNAAQNIEARGLEEATRLLALASAPNPRTAGARPHQSRATRAGRGNPTGGKEAA